jgi:uncharacterized protein
MSKAGSFCWYDLMAEDVDGSKKFYSTMFGWDIQPFDQAPADKPYDMWVGPKGPLGGVMKLPDEAKAMGAPPHWLAYTAVSDAAATVAKVGELGGETLVPVTEIPGGGNFAILRDPQGAVFGVVSDDQPDKDDDGEVAGTMTWHELAAADYEKAFDFYSTIFGWNKGEAMDMGPPGTYQMYANGDKTLGGMFNKSDDMPGPPFWLVYVTVADCDAAVEKAKGLGAKVLNGPMDVPGGDRIAQMMDPDGAAFALHALGKKD